MSIRFGKMKSEVLIWAAVLVYFLNCIVGFSAEPGSEIGADSIRVSNTQTKVFATQPKGEKFSSLETEESGQAEVENFTQAYEELLHEMLSELPPERSQQILRELSDSEDHFKFTESSSSATETILKGSLLTLKEGARGMLTSADVSDFLKNRELILSRLTEVQVIENGHRHEVVERSREFPPLSQSIGYLPKEPSHLICSPDGTRVFAEYNYNKMLDIINSRNGKMTPIEFEDKNIRSFRLSPNGRYLGIWFTRGPDVEIRDSFSGALIATIKPSFWQKMRSRKYEHVLDVTFSPDNSRVLISYESYFVVWDLKLRKEIYRVHKKKRDQYTPASFVSDSKFIPSSRSVSMRNSTLEDWKVSLWDAQLKKTTEKREFPDLWTPEEMEDRFRDFEEKIFHLLSPIEDGQIHYLSSDGKVFDFSTGKVLLTLENFRLGGIELDIQTFDSYGAHLVGYSRNHDFDAGVWNIKNGQLIHRFSTKFSTNIRDRHFSLSLVPQRPLVIMQSLKELKIWNMETQEVIFSTSKAGTPARVSPDGSSLFIMGMDDTARDTLFKVDLDVLLFEGESKTL